ncbi:MAG: phosphoribosylformylglycinamidine synthase subunit PurQ, partial [Oscillospiraceae bacterium]|nr:phosphoribosylformylglycinamidine synthase subunit PurQ [Oscillospiraceae bacterium]
NDFGAGGVSVAIGELADGLRIDLDAVRKKYDGLDGTELAISESQERMAVCVEAKDADAFIAYAEQENLEAYRVAIVTEEARMVMTWKGNEIANLSRDFLNTNGAVKHTAVSVSDAARPLGTVSTGSLKEIASNLKFASQRGLVERFDATIGAGSVLMPFGGKNQSTPTQAMAAKLPVLPGEFTNQASLFAWGCDPDLLSADPFIGAQASIVSSVAKIVAAGADYKKVYLTLQEFFEKLRNEPARWGKPFQALLGALQAQLGLNAAAIGGKDSMSGTFLDKDVPPTLISFAIAPLKAEEVISNEFKAAGHPVYRFGGCALNDYEALKANWEAYHALCQAGKVVASWAVDGGGIAEGVMKMAFGNSIGFKANPEAALSYGAAYGEIIAELTEEIEGAELIGWTTAEETITYGAETVSIDELYALNTAVLEKVYPTQTKETDKAIPTFSSAFETRVAPAVKVAKPKVLIPVFPGTNCEYDSARAVMAAGADADIVVIRNLTADDVARSVETVASKIADSQVVFIPGGFSGGDEPDGSAKFITAFFRNPAIKEQVTKLLEERDGLMCGICNGFQALIKLGLVPYGKIIDTDDTCPTLTFNTIGRHQSRIVRTRIASNKSPWLSLMNVGDVVNVAISHGEGRFFASPELALELAKNGQIATQYVDLKNEPTMDAAFNPNGSLFAIEGITSPDGRVFGKMGHSERIGKDLYRNVPGQYDIRMFEAAVKYFKG